MSISLLLYMMMAAPLSSQNPPTTVPELRAVIAPFLRCAQQFDHERVDVQARLDETYDLVEQGSQEQRLDFGWEMNRRARELGTRLSEMHSKIDEVCRRAEAERTLLLHLSRLSPASPPQPAWPLSRKLFDTLLQLDRDLAAYKAGKAPVPPIPPRAPPPRR